MKDRTMWLYLVAALAALFVAISSIALAVAQGSWEPVMLAGWLPAVIVAVWPGARRRRCLPHRDG